MSAHFSPCRTWRYSLTRDVAPLTGHGTVTFIGLNPSTADEQTDDPTIRRCTDFARRWGFARLTMVNLNAFRATDPSVMLDADDPVGPDNDRAIAEAVGRSDLVVCAWGINAIEERAREALSLVPAPHCLELTKHGAPRHPLYVKATTTPMPLGRGSRPREGARPWPATVITTV